MATKTYPPPAYVIVVTVVTVVTLVTVVTFVTIVTIVTAVIIVTEMTVVTVVTKKTFLPIFFLKFLLIKKNVYQKTQKTQLVMNFKISKCDETQKLKL